METQAQIPAMKLAKVGQNRKKNKFAPFLPSWLGGGSAAAPWASGGISLGAKMVIVFLISTLGVGAFQAGRSLKPNTSQTTRSSFFQSKNGYGNVEGLPSDNRGYQNSL